MLPKTLTGLTKINFDARMTEKPKNLATKRQVENGFDLRDKNIVKIKKNWNVWFKLLYWSYLPW